VGIRESGISRNAGNCAGIVAVPEKVNFREKQKRTVQRVCPEEKGMNKAGKKSDVEIVFFFG
jgi:hypothetical protein